MQTGRYIHLNPVKAGIVSHAEEYPWSSYRKMIGLPDQEVKEAAERIQSAIDESGYEFPKKKIIISLAPEYVKKWGSHFDLAMAIGLLMESDEISFKNEELVAILKTQCEEYGYSARVIHKLLRLARTSADLDGAGDIRLILKRFSDPERVYHASMEELLSVKDFGIFRAETVRSARSLSAA